MSYINSTSDNTTSGKPPVCQKMITVPPIEKTEPWVELCATKEEREQFFSLGAESYQHGTTAKRYIQDTGKRVPFLTAFFRYYYEKKISNGEAFLGSINRCEMVDGQKHAKTVFYGLYEYNTEDPTEEAENSELSNFDEKIVAPYLRCYKWLQDTIHTPMRKMAEDMGTEAWYHANHMMVQEFKGQGHGIDYCGKLMDAAYAHGLAKHAESGSQPFKTPPFYYTMTSDTYPGALRLFDRVGMEMVGHYHYNYDPGLQCYLETSAKDPINHSCKIVYANKKVAPLLREMMKLYIAPECC